MDLLGRNTGCKLSRQVLLNLSEAGEVVAVNAHNDTASFSATRSISATKMSAGPDLKYDNSWG